MIDNNKFAYLPNGTNYTVRGSATTDGIFDVRIQEVVGGEVATTNLWTDIPLVATTRTRFSISSNTPSQIEIDQENDGTYHVLTYSSATAGILESTGSTANVDAHQASGDLVASSTGLVLGVSTSTISTSSPQTGIVPGVTIYAATSTKTIAKTKSVQSNEAKELRSYEAVNSAVVYKSFDQKVKSAFRQMWSWVKNKLQ